MNHAKCYIREYPRPQFVRADWLSLNGEWAFGFGEEVTRREALAGRLPRKICVPFTYETEMSGIGDPAPHETVWYARTVEKRAGKRNILNIDGADYLASVYVNGKKAGEKRVGKNARAYFKVTYQSGELVAVGLDRDGRELCRTQLTSGGKSTVLSALPESSAVKQDELWYVKLQYTDEGGIWKPLARGDISVDVQGGKLVALGSACPYNARGYASDVTDTYFGEALAIVRPDKGAHKLVLSAESPYGSAVAEAECI